MLHNVMDNVYLNNLHMHMQMHAYMHVHTSTHTHLNLINYSNRTYNFMPITVFIGYEITCSSIIKKSMGSL